MHVDGFTYGLMTPALAYIMSCTGSALGLQSMSRARAVDGWPRRRWLTLGAVSIGGTGIWVMHFVAMLGFTVPGVDIAYDVPMTIASLVASVLVVGLGLVIVVRGDGTPKALLAGGTLTGCGVAGMHYLGMAAMHMPAVLSYDPGLVTLSVVIAVIAATVALWFTLNIRGALATAGAALVMGVAVCGMHYTGMSALHVNVPTMHMDTAAGASASGLLTPLIIGISISTVLMMLVVALAPTEKELREEVALEGYVAKLQAARH